MSSPSEGQSSPMRRPFNDLSLGRASPSVLLEDADHSISHHDLPSAFASYTDYSKHNVGKHSASRNDTFRTPSSLHNKPQVPGRLDKRWNLGDTKTLQEICEQGFQRSAQQMGLQFMGEMRTELQQAMGALMSELQAEVQRDGREREAAIEGKFGDILQQMQQLHEDSRQPDLRTTLGPLREEIQSNEAAHMEGLQNLTKSVEDRLENFSKQVHGEVLSMGKSLQKVEESTVSAIRIEIKKLQGETDPLGHPEASTDPSLASTSEARPKNASEAKLDKVINMQQTLSAALVQTDSNMKQMHEEHVLHNAALDKALEGHINKLVERDGKKQQQRTDVVVAAIKETLKLTNTDIKILMNELTKIQKALNVDFAQMVDDIQGIKTLTSAEDDEDEKMLKSNTGSRRPSGEQLLHHDTLATIVAKQDVDLTNAIKIKKRVREYWCQTDGFDIEERWTQTDESLMREHQGQKGKKKPKQAMTRPGTENLSVSNTKPKKSVMGSEKKAAMNVFADEETMKMRMREALIKPQYNVSDFYHRYGIAQAVATHVIFEQLTLLVIFFNAMWIWIDTDYNDTEFLLDAHPVFQVAEHFFCVFFTFELIVRFLAFNGKRNCLRDAWFIFDTLLVAAMVTETWILTTIFAIAGKNSYDIGNASILRVVRLARMVRITRIARMLRAIPELMILIKGLGAAFRSVCVFFLLWFIIIYVFAVVFKQLAEDTDVADEYFKDVPAAMNTLLLEGILPDNAILVRAVAAESWTFWIIMMFFIGLAGLTVMYMLVGVLVDVVGAIASTEKEAMTVSMVATVLREKLEELGRDAEEPITKYEFSQLLMYPEIAVIVQDVGVDVVVLIDMVDIIYDDPLLDVHGLTFHGFINIILNMRGKNAATVKDVKELVRVFKSMVKSNMADLKKDVLAEFRGVKDELWQLKAMALERAEDEESVIFEDELPAEAQTHHEPQHLLLAKTKTEVDSLTVLVGQVKSDLRNERGGGPDDEDSAGYDAEKERAQTA